MKINRILVLAAAVGFVVAGCSSTPTEQKPAPAPEAQPAPPPPPPAPPPAPEAPKAVEAPPPVAMDPLNDPNSILARRSVYFDFDKSLIHESDVPIIEAHGNYLVSHASRTVRIEGNCDERGSHEYNLALGQRRAEAVRARLKLLGVPTSRVETISLGKEKPRNPGHNEAAWAENRRSDIIYK